MLRPADFRTWRTDAVSGLMLAGLLVPQGIAYAGIAGVEPQRGLYAAAAGLFAYALLGTGRQTVVSPTSSAAAILATTIVPLAGGDPARYAVLASAMTITLGVLFVGASLLQLGAVSDFISRPVLKGFMFGLGMTIALKQLAALTGMPSLHGEFFRAAHEFLASLGSIRPLTFALGSTALVTLFFLARRAPGVPGGLVVLAAGILVSALFGLSSHGVAVVGLIPAGLPAPRLPGVGFEQSVMLAEAAAGIALVAFSEALGTGRTYGAKYDYEIQPNRELIALGVANLASGVLQGIPVGVGASGSAVNERAGARSQLSALAASMLVALTLVLLMPLFRPLPQAVLAAIVIHAVSGLLDVAELRRYVRLGRGWIPALTALAGVLVLGVLRGMLLAMIVNIVLLLKRMAVPGLFVLGRLPDTETYVDVEQYPAAEPIPGLLMVRLDGLLFFGNVAQMMSRMRELIRQHGQPLKEVILGCDVLFDIDVAGLDMLEQLRRECASRSVALTLSRAGDRLRALLDRSGLARALGEDHIFYSQKQAVAAYRARHPEIAAGVGGSPPRTSTAAAQEEIPT